MQPPAHMVVSFNENNMKSVLAENLRTAKSGQSCANNDDIGLFEVAH